MKRLLFGTLIFILTASAATATPSLHFSTAPGTAPSWLLANNAGVWTLSFTPTGIEVDDNPGDAVYLDRVGLPTMKLTNIVVTPGYILARLRPLGPLTITDDTGGMGTVMSSALANGGSLTVGTTYLAYSKPNDDMDITSLTGGYSQVLDDLQTAELAGYPIDFSFTGSSHTNLYALLSANIAGSSATGTIEGNIYSIPAPGAVVLGSLGAGLVGWLRRRRSL